MSDYAINSKLGQFKTHEEDYSIEEEIFKIIGGTLKEKEQELRDTIDNQREEIDRLKDLCNKYEEEHKTAFKLWTQKIEEMPDYEERMKLKKEVVRLNNIIKNQDRKIKLAIKIFENINKIYGESSSINDVIDVLKENK